MSIEQAKGERSGLPRYYAITALVMLMLLTLAGGLIYYRLALDALTEQTSGQNRMFATTIEQMARRAAAGADVADKLQERSEVEMAQRPVVKVVVYDDNWRIRFSTNRREIGTLFGPEDYTFTYYREDGEITRYAAFDTGKETLRAHDLVVTQINIHNDYWFGAPGITIYTDVTAERRKMIRMDALVAGGIEVLLAIILTVILVRRT
jgi:hypothetical protein